MIEFLVDNIYMLGLVDSIPMGINCVPLLADLYLCSIENDKLIKEGKRKLARKFDLSYRYIYDLISFNNERLRSSSPIFTPKTHHF